MLDDMCVVYMQRSLKENLTMQVQWKPEIQYFLGVPQARGTTRILFIIII